MKSAIVAIFALALTMGVQASIIPWGAEVAGHGLSYTAVSGPAVGLGPWGLGHGGVLGGVGPVWAGAGPVWGAPAGVWGGNGLVWGGHGPAAVTVAETPSHVVGHGAAILVGHGHEGSYIAKTRGAIHKAPLAGHINSVASINVAPAPGTH